MSISCDYVYICERYQFIILILQLYIIYLRDKVVENPSSYAGQNILAEFHSQTGNFSTAPSFQQFVRYWHLQLY
jgi:hypothetical protein